MKARGRRTSRPRRAVAVSAVEHRQLLDDLERYFGRPLTPDEIEVALEQAETVDATIEEDVRFSAI